jgi:hypothetical protein
MADEEPQRKYPLLAGYKTPESSKDPIGILKDIFKDKDIDGEGKQWLLQYSATRFKNRRIMAYMALSAILLTLVFLLVVAIIDSQSACVMNETCQGALVQLSEVEGLLSWIAGFLATIVATYYGMSSFRPSS